MAPFQEPHDAIPTTLCRVTARSGTSWPQAYSPERDKRRAKTLAPRTWTARRSTLLRSPSLSYLSAPAMSGQRAVLPAVQHSWLTHRPSPARWMGPAEFPKSVAMQHCKGVAWTLEVSTAYSQTDVGPVLEYNPGLPWCELIALLLVRPDASCTHLVLTNAQRLLSVEVHLHLPPGPQWRRQTVRHLHAHHLLRSKQTLILHAGPSDKAPALASIEGGQAMRDRASPVTIPRDQQPPVVEAAPSDAVHARAAHLRHRRSGPREAHTARAVRMAHSRGNEIWELTGHSVYGWKLVRLSRTVGPGSDNRRQRALGCASDGRGVVAVLARNVSASMTKALKFQFLDSGLDGSMGETWEIMAIMTGLQPWYYDMLSASMATTTTTAVLT
ncbi:uncharacterized protein KD926_010984 [Aspergillus affinis]|uniref:uncharacterized protein n=1 Tax=Aspergillus affinis TaxID=1070780 RepID=UPI0022FDE62C|nr:uncharacterized protein KD926_010984 [Aspergillus affinis]KAI9044812.1 hypothetical protein KD926_010984 [Aspergillus affinis]